MPGFGFGFGQRTRSAGLVPFDPVTLIGKISPSEQWDGTAASGFSAIPADPVRTSAKPGLRLITPPKQFYTDELLVGFAAAANDGGTLLNNMGLEKVTVHFEGSSVDIAEPSFESFHDANGVSRTYFGWWIRLKHDGRIGRAVLYAEAIPRDGSMQRRVLGPVWFNPAAQIHDYEIEIDPTKAEVQDVTYPNWPRAVRGAYYAGAQNPLFRIVNDNGGMPMDLGDWVLNQTDIDGYVTLVADVPVTIGKTGYTTEAEAKMQYGRTSIRMKGENITLDFANVMQFEASADSETTAPHKNHWLDGIRITNSNGRDSLWLGGPHQINNYLIRGNPWLTECDISEVSWPLNSVSVARGCRVHYTGMDTASNALCLIGCHVTETNNEFWNTDLPAFTVEYSGAEATATLSRSGGSEGYAGGIYTATWGANTATFDVGNGRPAYYEGTSGDGFFFSDVVDWLNTLPGWTATMDPAMAAADRRACTGTLPGIKGRGFGVGGNSYTAQYVKGASLTVYSYFDKHGDFYQNSLGMENVLVINNLVNDCDVQLVFNSPNGGSARDMLFINNAMRVGREVAFLSQQGRAADTVMSHVVMAHNTLTDQGIYFTTPTSDFDGYCLYANNVAKDLRWGGIPDASVTISENHLADGATGTGDAGETVGGREADLFGNATAGDFSPAGALLANLKPPTVRWDTLGNKRSSIAPAGAFAR